MKNSTIVKYRELEVKINKSYNNLKGNIKPLILFTIKSIYTGIIIALSFKLIG